VFASARVAGGALDFDASLREVGERRVAIAARGEARWPAGGDTARLLRAETTRVEIEGRGLDVAIAAPLLPRTLRAPGGELDVDLAIAGGGTAPDVSGRVVLRDGGIDVPLARRRYAPIEGAFSLADGVVHVERLAIGLPKDRDGEGPERRGLATIEGDVALDGLVPSSLDLRADLDGFRLSSAPILTTDVRGRLAVHGPLDALAIEGDVRLEDASVRLPDEDDRALREIQVIAASSQDTAASEFAETRARDGAYARSRVDVRIRVPRNTWVRGRGAEVDLQGDVRLAKRPHDALRAVGEARVVRGSLDFQRKRFDLRRGVVTFDGGDDPGDPVIDFEGVHRVRDVNVVIEIAGRLSDPPQLVQLGGEPPMSRDEALAYLVFGRPIDELAQAERGQVQSAALSVAASLAAGEFGRLIADAGIVDTLDIEIGEDGSAQALRVGKYVGDRTFVRYGQTFGDQSEQELQIEYRFTRHLSVESQMSTTGEAGADLILRAEY
ncbi:MAG: translocation/assembly module TamB, partial [Myxococcales bacterium]|nr:translocation/assembly module TamB [Myxococcales bacterium]